VSLLGPSSTDRSNVRVPKTAELVAARIRRQVVTGELKEDDALPSEAALMEEFSISRPTLREAFRILESEGLITVRRGARGGARVQEPSHDVAARYTGLVLQHRHATLDDVLEARMIVEAPAARMLAARRDRGASANALQELLDARDVDEAGHFHEFNAKLVQLTGNQTLILLTAMLEHISQAAALTFVRRSGDDRKLMRKAHRTRERLIELIRAGQADEAEELWRTHLNEARRLLVEGAGSDIVELFG
jgi:DNA-binding FadR family transcriptional regulator